MSGRAASASRARRSVRVGRALAAILAASSAVGLLPPAAPCLPLAAEDAAPAPGDRVRAATKLRDEAKALFATAGDSLSDSAERVQSRRTCWKKLKEARELLDAHLKDHPGDSESLDRLYCDVSSMLFWVKKEMTLEDMKALGIGRGGAPTAPPSPPAGGPPATGGTGGIGGAAPKEPPPGDPATGGGSGGPRPPEPDPAPPAAPGPADRIREIQEFARANPGDVPGQHERWAAFLDSAEDTSSPEYGIAAESLRVLEARMKDVYRVARDDDPETVRGGTPAEVERRIRKLVADLSDPDVARRVRAAKLLGALSEADAAPALVDLIRRQGRGEDVDAAADALGDIGGRRAFDRLLQAVKKDESVGGAALRSLRRALAKGGPSGRTAGEMLARCAQSWASEETQFQVVEDLRAAGPAGALGLAAALHMFVPDARKEELIGHVGRQQDPRVCGELSKFLVTGATGVRGDHCAAAREAIQGFGGRAVRHVLPALDDPALAVWTGEVLRNITGTRQKDDKRKTWEAWYRKNRRSLEGG